MSTNKSRPSSKKTDGSMYTPQKAVERFTVGPASRAFFKATYGEAPEDWAAKQGSESDEMSLMKTMVSRILGGQMGDPKQLETLGEAAKAEWAELGFDDSANISILQASDRLRKGQTERVTENDLKALLKSDKITSDGMGLLGKEAGVSLDSETMAKATRGLSDMLGMIFSAAQGGATQEADFKADDFVKEIFGIAQKAQSGRSTESSAGSTASRSKPKAPAESGPRSKASSSAPSEEFGAKLSAAHKEAFFPSLRSTGQATVIAPGGQRVEELSDSEAEGETADKGKGPG